MGGRRSPDRSRAEQEWARFVDANHDRFAAAGLPRLASANIARWDDLLTHGSLRGHEDPERFTTASLSPEQYAVFADLVESYFVAGYEYFTPAALKIPDQRRLDARFG